MLTPPIKIFQVISASAAAAAAAAAAADVVVNNNEIIIIKSKVICLEFIATFSGSRIAKNDLSFCYTTVF